MGNWCTFLSYFSRNPSYWLVEWSNFNWSVLVGKSVHFTHRKWLLNQIKNSFLIHLSNKKCLLSIRVMILDGQLMHFSRLHTLWGFHAFFEPFLSLTKKCDFLAFHAMWAFFKFEINMFFELASILFELFMPFFSLEINVFLTFHALCEPFLNLK